MKKSAIEKHIKINKTTEDMKSLLIEALSQQNFTFIDQYARSIGVYRASVVRHVHNWSYDRTAKVGINIEYDILIASEHKDASFTERYRSVMNYIGLKNKNNETFFV